MKMKRFLAMIVAMCMMLALLPVPAFAASPVDGGYCGDNVQWVLYSDGLLQIYGAGEMENYSHSYKENSPWSQYADSITSIEVLGDVTTIGREAFYGLENLKEIEISDSVTKIGNGAFYDCASLTQVDIPDSVTSIGSMAFYRSGLTSVTVPSSVTEPSGSMFGHCTDLTYVEYGAEVLYSCFTGCNNLSEIVLLDGVKTIDDYALYGLKSLTTVTIPYSVTIIGEDAFYSCKNLAEVYYTGSEYLWNKISFGGGNNCLLNQATIYFLQQNEPEVMYSGSCGDNVFWELYDDGLLKIVGSGEMEDYSFGWAPWREYYKYITKVVVDDGVTRIGHSAFEHLWHLEEAIIGDDVSLIDRYAFYGCNRLKNVYMGKQVDTIEWEAFDDCESLSGFWVDEENMNFSNDDQGVLFNKDKTILVCVPDTTAGKYVVPESVQKIEDYAFYRCDQLTEVVIGDQVTELGIGAFGMCDALTDVYIGAGLAAYGNSVFSYCDNLKGFWIDSENPNFSGDQYGVWYDKERTEILFVPPKMEGEYICPDTVETIKWKQFAACTEITEVVLGAMVAELGYSAFLDCTALKSVNIPAQVTVIQNDTFNNCTNLETVNIDGSIVSIQAGAFSNCASLKEIKLSHNLATIEDNAFIDCVALKTITFGWGTPDMVISDTAFQGVTAIAYYPEESPYWTEETMLQYGGELTWIPYKLGSAVIAGETTGDGVKWKLDTQGNLIIWGTGEARYNSGWTKYRESITTVTVKDNISLIGSSSFEDCTNLISIRFLGVSPEIGYSVFKGCHQLQEIVFTGDAPYIRSSTSFKVPPTAYYRQDNPTWTEDFFRRNSQYINWVPLFGDVQTESYYCEPVMWAYEQDITAGKGSLETFCPEDFCTREQIVTFLWRAAGKPEPTTTENPFTDVTEASYAYKAILWAVENGITTGTSATTFGLQDVCTREQIATFLWRAAGKPEPVTTENSFTDVTETNFGYKAILWAAENGITTGYGNGLFGLNDTCTRGQIVTFLYRAFAED